MINKLALFQKVFIGILLISACFSPTPVNAQTTEPRGSSAMSAFDRLPYIKNGTTVHQVASYDRTNGNADGNAYSYYRHPTTGGYVVLEENAPGTIYRIWATALNGGNIRIYFDGQTTPKINMPVTSFFSGTTSPFLTPLVGNDQASSGGFYSYYPITFQKSVRVEFTNVPNYYDITYHLYNSATGVTTYSGTENLTATYNAWNNTANDPKTTTANQTVNSGAFTLPAGQTKQLLNNTGAGSVRSVKLTMPQLQTTQSASGQTVTDNGRAFNGSSTFRAAIESANDGIILSRRFDYGVANQTADVYVDGVLAGRWSTPGSDGADHWRDSEFAIPASLTQGKSAITVKVQFVSSAIDWNEFYYWIKTKRPDGTIVQTDTLDVNNTASETAHNYVIAGALWEGTRSYTYPASLTVDAATIDILSNTRIQMFWDGETTPSVDLPIGFFFGVGSSGEARIKGLLMGVDPATHTYYNYFPMPYGSAARIQLVNNSSNAITSAAASLQYNTTAYSNLGSAAGYFVAQYAKENPTTTGKDFTWANFPSGTGHVVGSLLNISGVNTDLILEGDERIFIDGSSYNPQVHGTGTEDVFNGGFYFSRGIFSLPVHGAPLKYQSGGSNHTMMYRLELADAIPFEKSLLFKIEHGETNNVNATHEGAVFAYLIKNKESLQLNDTFTVGNTAEEAAHAYTIATQTWSGSANYDFFGRDTAAFYNGTGRAHKGTSQFKMTVNPNNKGVRLGRIMDHGIANQKANIFVDNVLVGTWFTGGVNSSHRALYDYFEIPASFTQGKSAITVKVQFVSSAIDWNEFTYFAYSHLTPATPDTANPSVTITAPANGAQVNRNTAVSINASASDAVGVRRVEFYVNNQFKCTDTTAPYSCTWAVPSPAGVSYTVQAKAYDSANNSAVSSVSVTSR